MWNLAVKRELYVLFKFSFRKFSIKKNQKKRKRKKPKQKKNVKLQR